MDRWGVDGCEQRFDEIVVHLVKQAKKHKLTSLFGTRPAEYMARRWTRQAIDAARYGIPPEDPEYRIDQWPFVWTYWAGGAVGDELRYSIASVRRWQPDARVVVIGDRPDWYDGEFIHKPRIKKRPHHAFKDCYSKLLAAAERIPQFVWMMDDVYWIKPFTIREAATPKYVRHVSQQRFHAWNPSNKWGRTRQDAYDWLITHNHPTYDFAAHMPQPIRADTFRKNEEDLRLMEHYRNWECLYFNRFHAASAEDWGRRFLRVNRPVDEVRTSQKLLNHTHKQFHGAVETFLRSVLDMQRIESGNHATG